MKQLLTYGILAGFGYWMWTKVGAPAPVTGGPAQTTGAPGMDAFPLAEDRPSLWNETHYPMGSFSK